MGQCAGVASAEIQTLPVQVLNDQPELIRQEALMYVFFTFSLWSIGAMRHKRDAAFSVQNVVGLYSRDTRKLKPDRYG
ncbi:hypothetical protein [Maritimibacter sp. 55A14]|uniref:hypothetical protein n=1 Tax=Maritimibacter sp. 55A14 TaxID=2174844 RepID=UPI0011B1D1BC|nr:hypothetical protein [Maritimibacter sp. 55A14]